MSSAQARMEIADIAAEKARIDQAAPGIESKGYQTACNKITKVFSTATGQTKTNPLEVRRPDH
jgi:hypothetical protein